MNYGPLCGRVILPHEMPDDEINFIYAVRFIAVKRTHATLYQTAMQMFPYNYNAIDVELCKRCVEVYDALSEILNAARVTNDLNMCCFVINVINCFLPFGASLLMHAAYFNDTHAIGELIKHRNLNDTDIQGRTALSYANTVDAAMILYTAGMRPTTRDMGIIAKKPHLSQFVSMLCDEFVCW